MDKREKVIKGLEWCMNEKHDCYREKGCPYENEGDDIGCKYALHRDAIALLKAQEPRVHARWRELKDGTEECTNCLGLCPHEENYNGDVIFNFGCEYCPWCGAKMDGDTNG